MPKVLIIGRIHEDGLERLAQMPGLAVTVTEDPDDKDEAGAAMADAVAVLVRTQPITAAMIAGAPALRVVSRHGVGHDSVDLAALTARRIPLAVAATANMVAVAEHAFAMLLALVKRSRQADEAVRAGRWSERHLLVPTELAGKTLLLVGLGRAGRQLARRALAFGMRVLAVDPNLSPAQIREAGAVPMAGLMTALPEADAVSLHLPLTAATRGLIGEAQFRTMRAHAVLVNTARGGLVDETALVAALREGRIEGAGLDVLDEEPPRADNPLLCSENVILSPHLAGVTAEAKVRMAIEAAENVLAALAGRLDPAVCVNPEVLQPLVLER